MSFFGWKASSSKDKTATKLFFGSDFHGSERTFRKFVNSAKHYGADVLVMGGDIVGKLAIPIIREGHSGYRAHLMGRTEHIKDDADLKNLHDRLGKLQIVKINEKDVVDLAVLLLEHPWGEGDEGTLNLGRIARLCVEDWGLWRTTGLNLEKLERMAGTHEALDRTQRHRLTVQIEVLKQRLEAEPKPFSWRMRAKVGERVKWYRDVDEVH